MQVEHVTPTEIIYLKNCSFILYLSLNSFCMFSIFCSLCLDVQMSLVYYFVWVFSYVINVLLPTTVFGPCFSALCLWFWFCPVPGLQCSLCRSVNVSLSSWHLLSNSPHTPGWNMFSVASCDVSNSAFSCVLLFLLISRLSCWFGVLLYLFPHWRLFSFSAQDPVISYLDSRWQSQQYHIRNIQQLVLSLANRQTQQLAVVWEITEAK